MKKGENRKRKVQLEKKEREEKGNRRLVKRLMQREQKMRYKVQLERKGKNKKNIIEDEICKVEGKKRRKGGVREHKLQ